MHDFLCAQDCGDGPTSPKWLILHSHCSAQRDALKDVYYGLIIFVLFLFLFLKDRNFSILEESKFFNSSTLENFRFISLEFYMKDFKSTKNTSKYPLTGYRPLYRAPLILLSFFLFYFFFAFYF